MPNGNKRVVHEGIAFPNGVRFSPDHAFLMVADTLSRWIWSFRSSPMAHSPTAFPSTGWRSRMRWNPAYCAAARMG